MKILNLDDFARVTRVVMIKGKKYEVVETSVEDFIAAQMAMKEMEDKKAQGEDVPEEDIVASLGRTFDVLKKVIPGLSDKVLRSLNMTQLGALVQFIRGELDEKAEVADGGEASDGEGKPLSE